MKIKVLLVMPGKEVQTVRIPASIKFIKSFIGEELQRFRENKNTVIIANKNAISTTTINDIQEIVGLGTISDSNTGTSSKADVIVIIGRDYDE